MTMNLGNDIVIWKSNITQNMNLKNTFCTLRLKGCGFHTMPAFFNMLSGDLYFDAIIIGLFPIYLVTGQILGEDAL